MTEARRLMTIGLLAALLVAIAPGEARAEKGPYWRTSYAAHMSKKLLRGTQNIFFCVVEIPKEIIIEWQRTDPFTGLWFGFGKGLFSMGKRFSFGVYDLMTFGFRLPWDDRIDPEVVLLDRIE